MRLPEEFIQSFRYEKTNAAFSVFSPNPWGDYGITSFPLAYPYTIPGTSRKGFQFFLNSDAQQIGTNTTEKAILEQDIYLEAVKGVRSSLDKQTIELCNP
mmetsp:Transcript_2269/g.3315  ORF Transcript_2269/g.3315 Transcript_2269/m.3315 type:complete len:100 (+) Transcript_2269:319-618(+)